MYAIDLLVLKTWILSSSFPNNPMDQQMLNSFTMYVCIMLQINENTLKTFSELVIRVFLNAGPKNNLFLFRGTFPIECNDV